MALRRLLFGRHQSVVHVAVFLITIWFSQVNCSKLTLFPKGRKYYQCLMVMF